MARELENPGPGEGLVNHLYADTKGFITIGAGLRVTPDLLAKIPFVYKGTTLRADPKAIAEDMEQVSNRYKTYASSSPGRKGKLVANAYADVTNLQVDPAELRKLAIAHLNRLDGQFSGRWLQDFHSYPQPAQRAIIDMAYNRGFQRLMDDHPLVRAIRKRDWAAASRLSDRNGVEDLRHVQTKNWLMEAAHLDSTGAR